jgi:hypothetical protein
MSLKAPSYILLSTLCVCALCMHFLSLQIYFSNSLQYILHCICALYVKHFMKFGVNIYFSSLQITFYILHFMFVHFMFCIYLSSLQITFYILHFVFVHSVCIFCLCTFCLCKYIILNSFSYILHCVYACVCVCTLCLFILF